MDKCEHLITLGKNRRLGMWCTACGEKIFELNPEPCSECTQYRRRWYGSICKKKMMGVVPSMRATYRIEDGTCFEAK